MLIWLSGMTAGLTAAACKKDLYTAEKKLRYCNITLVAGAWSNFIPIERKRSALLRLERGIALLQAGRPDEAQDAMAQAIRTMSSVANPNFMDMHLRIVSLDDPRLYELWSDAVDASQ